jgi:hypothetical protein
MAVSAGNKVCPFLAAGFLRNVSFQSSDAACSRVSRDSRGRQKNIEKYSKLGCKQQQCSAQYFQVEILVLNEPCPLRVLYKGFVLYTEKYFPAFVSCSMCFFVHFSGSVPVAPATYVYFTFRTFPDPWTQVIML